MKQKRVKPEKVQVLLAVTPDTQKTVTDLSERADLSKQDIFRLAIAKGLPELEIMFPAPGAQKAA